MAYKVKITHRFWKSADFLKQKYNKDEFKEIINEIEESILILRNKGRLSKNYGDHVLRRSPFVGQREYHVYDDDVLIIYSKNTNKKILRFIRIVDHHLLRQISK